MKERTALGLRFESRKSVNRTPVDSLEQMKSLVEKSGKAVALLIQRDDARIFVPVPLG